MFSKVHQENILQVKSKKSYFPKHTVQDMGSLVLTIGGPKAIQPRGG